MRWRRTAMAGVGLTAALISGGLAPATRPAAPPATRPAVAKGPVAPPKDWVRVENKANHFHFYVPKTWEASGVSDAAAAYTLPKTYPGHASKFTVTAGPTTATTVPEAADGTRDELQNTVVAKGGKINRDEAAAWAGRPAWAFEFQVPYEVPRPAPPTPSYSNPVHYPGAGNTGVHPTPGPAMMKRAVKTYELVRAEANKQYVVTLEADGQYYSAGVTTMKRVLDSFTWDGPPLTAADPAK